VAEARVDVWVDMFCVEFLYKSNPIKPGHSGIRKQISVFCEEEVTLVSEESGIRVEETEGNLVELSPFAFHRGSRVYD